ncbi:MAG TPA: NADH-quinone oxidoreductase subunit M [Acidisarcina sp.]|nr:NADH-quinone oxidoreductase subunit M [Acidisarcina sp.]
MTTLPVLTILTLMPVVGALLILFIGQASDSVRTDRVARALAVGFSLAALLFTLGLWHAFQPASNGLQFQEQHAWIPSLNIQYHLGIDGLGLLMVLLSAIVVLIGIAASWRVTERVPLYFSLVLLLQAGLFGTFTALNFFHWFLFWELSLIPAFFLIRLWGGPQRASAATQFFIYTMVGSVALLLAFLALFLATGSFDFIDLAAMARDGQLLPAITANLGGHGMAGSRVALLLFFAALLGFAVKVPLMPFHTWLPAAYAEAPTGTTILLTGAMSKMGVYGFLRILLPIFPQQMLWMRKPLLILAVATIVFSACAAFAQKDLKRIFAYSSINHLGYCLLGIFAVAGASGDSAAMLTQKAAAIDGVFLQMFNHGLTASVLFWFVSLIEKRSGGVRGLNDFGGLRKVAPVFCGLMGIALFSSLGLPGLNGFIGEFLIFKGVFPLTPWAASLSLFGLLVTAIVLLTILQRVFSGPLNPRWSGFADLSAQETLVLAPAIALMFLLGLYPQVVLGVVNGTALAIAAQLSF